MNYDFNKINSFDLRKSSQSVTNFKPNRPQSAPKSMNRFWEELKLTDTKESFLLLAGEYTSLVDGDTKEWKEYLLHQTLFVKGRPQQEIVCSAGWDEHAKQPCVGCVLFERGPKKENPWYPRPKVKFNVLSLASYHDNIPYVKDGKPMVKDDGKPVFIKQKCAGKGCAACGTYGKPSSFGRLMKLVLTGTHFTQLMNYNRNDLSCTCAGCGKYIVLNEYSCSQCDEQLLDVSNSTYNAEYLFTYSRTPQTCGKCSHVGLPKEGLDCGYNEAGDIKEVEDCPLDYPVRMNIFNTILSVGKQGDKTKSSLFFGDKRSILSNSKIKYLVASKKPIEEVLNEAVAANGGKLFDLDAETPIKNTTEQAQILNEEDPYAGQNSFPTGPVPQIVPMGGPMNGGFPVQFPNMIVR